MMLRLSALAPLMAFFASGCWAGGFQAAPVEHGLWLGDPSPETVSWLVASPGAGSWITLGSGCPPGGSDLMAEDGVVHRIAHGREGGVPSLRLAETLGPLSLAPGERPLWVLRIYDGALILNQRSEAEGHPGPCRLRHLSIDDRQWTALTGVEAEPGAGEDPILHTRATLEGRLLAIRGEADRLLRSAQGPGFLEAEAGLRARRRAVLGEVTTPSLHRYACEIGRDHGLFDRRYSVFGDTVVPFAWLDLC